MIKVILLVLLALSMILFGLIFWCACRVSAMADRELEEQAFRKQLEGDVNNG